MTPVHILVAEAFLGARPKGLVINHIDGQRFNNSATNLEYCTVTIIGDGFTQANLKDIACHPDYRGQGIASNIVKLLILDVPSCDVVRAETSRAKVLYERLSFAEYSGDVMELIR